MFCCKPTYPVCVIWTSPGRSARVVTFTIIWGNLQLNISRSTCTPSERIDFKSAAKKPTPRPQFTNREPPLAVWEIKSGKYLQTKPSPELANIWQGGGGGGCCCYAKLNCFLSVLLLLLVLYRPLRLVLWIRLFILASGDFSQNHLITHAD